MATIMFDAAEFGRKLRCFIGALGIEQQEAASQIGIGHSTLSRICKHGRAPSVQNYLRILDWMAKQKPRAEKSVLDRIDFHRREAWRLSEIFAGGPTGGLIVGPDGFVKIMGDQS